MTLGTERRTRGEQIGDILTAFEHIWKMYPKKSFNEVVADVFGASVVEGKTDDEVEAMLRMHLRKLMSGSRDDT